MSAPRDETRPMTSIGILGAGGLGMALAARLLDSGYRVSIASRHPAAATAERIGPYLPGVTAVSRTQAYDQDIVVLAIPLRRFRSLPPERLAGRIVIDVMNYLPLTDGRLAEFDADPRTTSEVLQEYLAEARVVRTLNHIGAREISSDWRPAGEDGRRAIAVAADDPEARRTAAEMVDMIGFDPVDAGPLANSRAFAPGSPIFHGRWTAAGLRAALDRALA